MKKDIHFSCTQDINMEDSRLQNDDIGGFGCIQYTLIFQITRHLETGITPVTMQPFLVDGKYNVCRSWVG